VSYMSQHAGGDVMLSKATLALRYDSAPPMRQMLLCTGSSCAALTSDVSYLSSCPALPATCSKAALLSTLSALHGPALLSSARPSHCHSFSHT